MTNETPDPDAQPGPVPGRPAPGAGVPDAGSGGGGAAGPGPAGYAVVPSDPYRGQSTPEPGGWSPGGWSPSPPWNGPGQHGPGRNGPVPPGTEWYGAAPPHEPWSAGAPSHRPRPPRRWGMATLVAVGVVAALLGGGAGGVVGAALNERNGTAGAGALPLPEVAEGAAPVGPVEAVAARVLPSVVQLRVEGRGGAGEGSGMVLGADGVILTNNHVVEAAADGGSVVVVFQDSTTAPARIVGLDPSSDLAVLRAEGVSGLTPIVLGDSDAIRVGQQVVAFGSPLGLGGSVTTGIVSALDRAVSVGPEAGASQSTVLNALQTDAAINPGNSGGPLVDMQGRVVGINSAIATTSGQGGSIGVGFSIPVNQARRIAEELEATGRATRTVLGVNVNSGGVELAGAVLGPVVPGGPADQAGLREGQVVTRLDDRVITNGNELIAAVRENAPGQRVSLVVDGRTIPVTLSGETG